jgi:hypothetical protein
MNRPAMFLLAMLFSTAAQAAEYMEKTKKLRRRTTAERGGNFGIAQPAAFG